MTNQEFLVFLDEVMLPIVNRILIGEQLLIPAAICDIIEISKTIQSDTEYNSVPIIYRHGL